MNNSRTYVAFYQTDVAKVSGETTKAYEAAIKEDHFSHKTHNKNDETFFHKPLKWTNQMAANNSGKLKKELGI